MSNPYESMLDLFSSKSPTIMGKVVSVDMDKVNVRMDTGNVIVVWGTANVGDSVMVRDGSILGRVREENIVEVYVP